MGTSGAPFQQTREEQTRRTEDAQIHRAEVATEPDSGGWGAGPHSSDLTDAQRQAIAQIVCTYAKFPS